jgi:hypothetical protein
MLRLTTTVVGRKLSDILTLLKDVTDALDSGFKTAFKGPEDHYAQFELTGEHEEFYLVEKNNVPLPQVFHHIQQIQKPSLPPDEKVVALSKKKEKISQEIPPSKEALLQIQKEEAERLAAHYKEIAKQTLNIALHGNYANGNTHPDNPSGADEGNVKAFAALQDLQTQLEVPPT